MNISDLANLNLKDLQKIDYKKLIEELRKRPDILINTGVILLCLFISIYIISQRQKEISTLKTEIGKLTEKVKAIGDYQSTQKQLAEFMSNIPKTLPEEELINTLTDFAAKRNVKIESFSPARIENTELCELTRIDISITINDYKTLWLFINDVEQSPYALRIDEWEASMTEQAAAEYRGGERVTPTEGTLIHVRLNLSSIRIKNG